MCSCLVSPVLAWKLLDQEKRRTKILTTNRNMKLSSERGFARPADVIDDEGLTLEKKLLVLESWQNDLIEMQRADEENMLGTASNSGQTAKWLAEVTKAIYTLRDH